jgi:hypothetical protein
MGARGWRILRNACAGAAGVLAVLWLVVLGTPSSSSTFCEGYVCAPDFSGLVKLVFLLLLGLAFLLFAGLAVLGHWIQRGRRRRDLEAVNVPAGIPADASFPCPSCGQTIARPESPGVCPRCGRPYGAVSGRTKA